MTDPLFSLRLARDVQDLRGAQRLRYNVFIDELGGSGDLVDHDARLECDAYDPHYDHLILVDETRDPALFDHVVGVYRLLRSDMVAAVGRYYTQDEYDLTPLISSGRRLLELGRSCVHADFRGGTVMHQLWTGLAAYVVEHDVEILFGVASFHGTDVAAIREPLALLHHRYLAPDALRVRAIGEASVDMNQMSMDEIDRAGAMRSVPSLIKAYLRLGGFVGEGAFVDHGFNTTDVCLVMDTARMNARQAGIYTRGTRG